MARRNSLTVSVPSAVWVWSVLSVGLALNVEAAMTNEWETAGAKSVRFEVKFLRTPRVRYAEQNSAELNGGRKPLL